MKIKLGIFIFFLLFVFNYFNFFYKHETKYVIKCPNLPKVYGHPDCSFEYPKYPGFELNLVEEFDEAIDFDNDPIWTWSDGGFDTNLVRFTKDSISFIDGKLRLTVREKEVEQSFSYSQNYQATGRKLASGELRTKYNNYRYGRYEAKIKVPKFNFDKSLFSRNYITSMFIYRTPGFQTWNEIDIEISGENPINLAYNFINCNNYPTWTPHIENPFYLKNFLDNSKEDFHTHAFEWTPSYIRWFVDDKLTHEVKASPSVHIPHLSAKIMFNLWVYNTEKYGKNSVTGSDLTIKQDYPFYAEYDWFRFYKWKGEQFYPFKNHSKLPYSDLDASKNNKEDGVANIKSVCKIADCWGVN